MIAIETMSEWVEKAGSNQQVEEIHWLYNEAEKINPRIIMEIGVYTGGTCFVLQNLLKKPDDILIGVDTYRQPFAGWDPKKITAQWYDCSDPVGTPHNGLQWNSHSIHTLEEIKKILNGRKIDVLFIDGDHSYSGTTQDYYMYSPLVRDGGMIGFHDLCMGGSEEQNKAGELSVKGFWKDLDHKKHSYCSAHLDHAYGIGYIIRNEHNSEISLGPGIIKE